MTTSPNNKGSKQISRNTREKLAITGVVILLALFALIYRLYKIQNDYSDEYNQKILSQQRYDSREIPFRRGDITDRNGTYLAISNKVYNLIIDPSQINSAPDDYLEPTLTLLNEVFGFDIADMRSVITEKSDSQYVRYAKALSYDEMTEFETRKTEINKQYKSNGDAHRVYGIWFEDAYQRTYPNGSLGCNVIGFSMSDGTEGSGGIEQYYNESLTGTSGREYGYLNDDSNLERVIKSAVDGNTVVSTIDVNIQTIVEKYIAQFQEEMGSKTTAVVVMNPSNGEILAMASNRKYDLNDPRKLDEYYTEEELANLDDQALNDAWNEIWRNYCVSDTYEPGSTSKIFTVASALEEGSISGSETYLCDGYEEVGGWTIKCNVVTGHGILDVAESLMQSCNDAMMQIVSGLGKERFCKFMDIFGFGKKTGIDLPGEADTSVLVHRPENMVPSDLATNSFGQNYNCTMVQMAAAYSSVINGGSYYEPHVVKQIKNSQGYVVEDVEPKRVCETVSANTSEFIKSALRRTVTEGTGGAASIPGYDIGGKTGTGEKYPRGQNKYLVSFIGFAPVDDPQVLCYVVVDEPNTEDQAHSSYASGIFRNIMAEVLPYMNVYRENESEYLDPNYKEEIVHWNEETIQNDNGDNTGAGEESHVHNSSEENAEAQQLENGGDQAAEGDDQTAHGEGEGDEGTAQGTQPAKRPYDRDEVVETQPAGGDVPNTDLPGVPAGQDAIMVEAPSF